MKRLSLLISLGFSAGSRFLPRMGFFKANLRRGECRVQPVILSIKKFRNQSDFQWNSLL